MSRCLISCLYEHSYHRFVYLNAQGCGKGCDNMSAVVVVLKPFSPFTQNNHEVDLNALPPMPALDDISPEFHGEPASSSLLFYLIVKVTCACEVNSEHAAAYAGTGYVSAHHSVSQGPPAAAKPSCTC